MPIYVPTVTEKTEKGEKNYDRYSRLLAERIIMLDTEVDPQSSSIVVASLMFLKSEDPKKPIHLYINSPGGCVTSGLAIYDTMKMITCPVYTYVLGQAASMGALLASSGDKRFITPQSRLMLHKVSGGQRGQIDDMEASFLEAKKLNGTLLDIFELNTGHSSKKIAKDIARDKWFDAKESIKYGLIDEIIKYPEKEDLTSTKE